jgi:hypothetical protein
MIIFLRNISLFFILFISAETAFAQIRCATDELHKKKMLKDTAYARQYINFLNTLNKTIAAKKASVLNKNNGNKRMGAVSMPDTIYIIPVVVHIVHNNASGNTGGPGNTNISDDKIISQISVINEDYRRLNADTSLTRAIFKGVAADPRIQFCLANRDPNGNFTSGITRNYTSKSAFDIDTDETLLKSNSFWPNDQYLNIWVAALTSSLGVPLGFTQFPTGSSLPGLTPWNTPDNLDGVCIDYKAFGTGGDGYNDVFSLYYQKGRTVTHEIGHYFGLFHPWGNDENTPCSDDFCADTPPDRYYNLNNCIDSSNCTGPYTLDITEDYMEYTPDACMNIFTKDQVLRMRTAIQIAPKRKSLLTSLGCCGEGMNEPFTDSFSEGFEDNNFLSLGWKILNPDTLETWTQTFSAGAGNSSGSIMIKNDSIYEASDPSKNKYYDLLITPFINYSNSEPPFLEFDLAYAKNTGTVIDSLVISYSILCDTVWTPLLILSGNMLPTTSTVQNMFVPAEADWKHFKLKMPMLSKKRFVRLRFEDYSKGGNNLYLDNVNIPEPPKKLIVHFYPIPASDIITIESIFNGTENIHFQLYNMLGETVLTAETSNTGSFVTTMDVSHLAEGMYVFKASIPDQRVIKKIIIKH